MSDTLRRQVRPGVDASGASDRAELQRLEQIYDAYSADARCQRIWSDTAARFMADRKWELIADVLRRERIDVATARVLNLGAGDGKDGARLIDLGIRADRIFALDLLTRFVRQARLSYAWMATVAGDAGRLPFEDERFDLVYQSTMMSSVLDASRRRQILEEVRRVLRPGGVFLSYDVRYPNPWNRHTRPVRVAELERGLAGWRVKTWSTTGLPPLLRIVAPLSLAACRAIETIPPLRSHLLALARKP